MTKASGEVIELSFKLDSLKSHIRSLNENSYGIAFSNDDFSSFPLFYLSNKYFKDIYDAENEAIGILFKDSKKNSNKIKALVSILQNESAWTNILAFNIFTEAVNNIDINAESIVPYSASEITWSLINLSGMDGALAMPVKTEVLAYIKASLDDEGWSVPPLPLMFKNIEDMYENTSYVSDVKKHLGHLSMTDIVKLEDFSKLDIDNRPDLKNYLVLNQEMCNDIIAKYDKMMFDWTTAIVGE